MGFLTRKPKVALEDFCRQFYDSQIFHPVIAGTDVGSVFWETVSTSLTEADSSFATMDIGAFQREMKALRVELFGLAWDHLLKRDKYTLPHTVFTKSYLEEKKEAGTWDAMGAYNQVIARSSIEIAAGERSRRGWITFMNKLRSDLFVKWHKAGVDPQCAAHVANRLGTDVSWHKGITLELLTDTALERLDCQLNQEARFRLQAVIYGLYEGAKEAINSVNVQTTR